METSEVGIWEQAEAERVGRGWTHEVQQPTRPTVTVAGKELGCSPHIVAQRASGAEVTFQPQEPAHTAVKRGDGQRHSIAVWQPCTGKCHY